MSHTQQSRATLCST